MSINSVNKISLDNMLDTLENKTGSLKALTYTQVLGVLIEKHS